MNEIKFGLQAKFHDFMPGDAKSLGEGFFKFPGLENNYALEYSIYAQNEQKVTDFLSLQYGLRYSIFQNIGKSTVYNFDENYNALDSSVYHKGEIYNTYSGFEPRFGARLTLDQSSSIKASYNRTVQYVHLARNATDMTPIDFWFPSNPNITPQKADQVAVGYFRNFLDNTYESSLEVYYKKIYDAIDFKDHANLLLNPQFYGELRTGTGYSYGLEFMTKKQVGKLTGWVSYTYSKTRYQIEEINNGKPYPTPFDKTHDISVIMSYEITPDLTFASNWIYSTAIPITAPTGKYSYENMSVPVYSERNGLRIPGTDYHRMDVSLTYDNIKSNILGIEVNHSFNLSVYNAYSRHNMYSVDFEPSEDEPGKMKATKLYLFKVIPAITYNFKF